MKMKRMVASVLTLLLAVSLLPIGAMADDLPNNTSSQANIDQPIGTNSGAGVGITENGSVQTNTGSVRENKGTVVNNDGRVVDNMSGGTVVNNNAGGTVEINRQGGTVVNNNAGGTVEFNEAGGTIETNNGTVGDQRWDGIVVSTSGNHGTVETNSAGGKVLINQEGGKIGTNEMNGIVETNNGTIDTNYGVVGKYTEGTTGYVVDGDYGNYGTINTNYYNITKNENLVVTNGKDGSSLGYIYINDGTVKNNETAVCENNGTVIINNGEVSNNKVNGTVETNNGTVSYNDGTVDTNNNRIIENRKDVGTNNSGITWNYGTVDTNNGKISNNHGIVKTNAIDGSMNNYNIGAAAVASNADADSTKEEPVVNGVGTNFGTVVDHQGNERITYYGLSWGDSVDNLTSIKSFVEDGTEGINLNDYAAKASRSGYKMTGFTAFARENGTDTKITDTANHTMKAPVWLQILWEKIAGKSSAPQPTKTPVYTKLSAEQVKVGMFVRCGKVTFKIIEVTDDSIRVAIVGKLSDEALADMLGFLKQHLSDAQIAKLMGAPELLEQELVAKFFGGSNEHIAFYASADLFA